MIKWNTNEEYYKKHDPVGYKRWRLVQLINYGLDGEKLDKAEVIKQWPHIKDELDIDSRKTLEFLIWNKKWQKEPGLRADRSNYFSWLRKKKISEINSI